MSPRSSVYDFFDKLEAPDSQKVQAQCKTCSFKMSHWHASTLKKHLRRKHDDVYQEVLRLEAASNPQNKTTDNVGFKGQSQQTSKILDIATTRNQEKSDYRTNYISGAHQISKVEVFEEVLDEPSGGSILWASTGESLERYIDESAPQREDLGAMQAVNEDIQRHRKLLKAKPDSVIDAALSSFLIACNLTFDIIDSPHFKHFVNSLNQSYKAPSSSQLKTRLLTQLKTLEAPPVKHRSNKRKKYVSSSTSDSN